MNVDDLNSSYAKCYALIGEKEPTELIYINGFDEEIDRVYIRYTTENKEEKSKFLEDVNIKFDILSPGLYNFKNSVVLLRKTSERQWKKGFCRGQYTVTLLLQDLYEGMKSYFGISTTIQAKPFDWCLQDIQILLQSPKYTYEQARKKLYASKGQLATSFNANWFLMPSLDSKGEWLFYRSCKVANIIDGVVIVTTKGFEEEVKDLNRLVKIGEVVC